MRPAVGIDLGTTYSAVAHVGPSGRPEVLPSSEGKPLTPSVVAFTSVPPMVGDAAREAQALGEVEVAAFFKRHMGDREFLFPAAGRGWTAVELSGLVLGKLRTDAERALGGGLGRAVITVPAYFNSDQRQATIDAGKQAGLDVRRVINEPTAAALAFGLHRTSRPETVLVYDLGGGTFDVSVVHITPDDIAVLATAGDHNLGGKDWDDRIAAHVATAFADRHGVNPFEESAAFNDLLVRAEKAKRELSVRTATKIAVHHAGATDSAELPRAAFQALTRDLMERTETLCETALREAGLGWSALTGVLLVGGSTRMPMVHHYVERMSGKPPMTGVNVDEAVSLGAAIRAALDVEEEEARPRFFLGARKLVRDVTAHTLGVIAESEDRKRWVNSKVVPRNTPVPASGRREYDVAAPGGRLECIVYVTEGESDDPLAVSFRGKYVCTGVSPRTSAMARVAVSYAYDHNGVIHVSASLAGGEALESRQEPVGDLSWLDTPPGERKVLDLSQLRLVTTPAGYDDIGKILSTLGLRFRLRHPRDPLEADILFLNCGTREPPDPASLRGFVESGGCLYASDLTDALIAQAFPGKLTFIGRTGSPGTQEATVEDPDLQAALGRTVGVTFDMGAWAELGAVAPDVRVLLRSRSTRRPLMVAFSHGQGTVFYTCFHNHAQTTEAERTLLQMLVLKQISAVSGLPIEVVARGRQLAAPLGGKKGAAP